jgi:hypothetical protein
LNVRVEEGWKFLDFFSKKGKRLFWFVYRQRLISDEEEVMREVWKLGLE